MLFRSGSDYRLPGPGDHLDLSQPVKNPARAAKISRQNIWGSVDFTIRTDRIHQSAWAATGTLASGVLLTLPHRPECDVHTRLPSMAPTSGSYVSAPTGTGWRFWCHCGHPALFNRTMEVTKHPKSGGAEHTQEWFGSVVGVPFV